jgi:hypothetical protein
LRRAFPTELLGKHAPLHFLDLAFRQIAEHERPERYPDQPIDGELKMLGNPLHFAVLAFAQGNGEPEIRSLLAVDARLNWPTPDAVDGDAVAQPVEGLWRDVAPAPGSA